MTISLAHHFKYARTVGHPAQSTAVNCLLKVSSTILAFFLLVKVLQGYRQSTSLSFDEAKMMLDRPFAVILVTDIGTIPYQVMPEKGDAELSDAHYARVCSELETALRSVQTLDFECAKFAGALSIPIAKFEQETYRNRQEMIRLQEAKITKVIFEDAVAAFFVNALNDYMRHVRVDRQKWSIFSREDMNVSVAAKKPLVLINSDSFHMRFARGLLAKQPTPFLNFLVINDGHLPMQPTSNTTKAFLSLHVQRSVLEDCANLHPCHLIRRNQLGKPDEAFVKHLAQNLSIAYSYSSLSQSQSETESARSSVAR